MQKPQEMAEKIKNLAKIRGVSISKMLNDCDLNKNAIYTMSVENAAYYPRIESIHKIADYLNCSLDYLLGRTQNMKVQPNSPELSEEDLELLTLFRKLPKDTAETFLQLLKCLNNVPNATENLKQILQKIS